MEMKSFLVKERGQALILIALAAIGLVAIVALAVDGTAKYSDRRHAQNAADASALASALFKANGAAADMDDDCRTDSGWTNTTFCVNLIDIAWDRATENGYQGLLPNSVDVYSPPTSGPYAGNTAYVQVIITSYINTYFARIIGIAQTRNIVEAVALTGRGHLLAGGNMIIAYDPHPSCNSGNGLGGGSFDNAGSGEIILDGGGILVNSQEACGYVAPNCGDLTMLNGGTINTVLSAANDNIDQHGCVAAPEGYDRDRTVIPDGVYWPDAPPECGITPAAPNHLSDVYVGSKLTGEWLIHPGYYEEFPPSSLVGNKQIIYMQSGVYCIDPGGPSHDSELSWSPVDFVSLYGSIDPLENKYAGYNPDGVTLYIKSGGGFSINANNATYLDATNDPDSDYQGYLIILEGTHPSIESCSITGGANIDINGMIYAPYCSITVNGGSQSIATINAQLIGWDIKLDGNNIIKFKYDPSNQIKIKRKVGLMR